MKKALKWVGIVFVVFIVLGMFMNDEEPKSTTAKDVSSEESDTTKEEEVVTTEEEAVTEEEEEAPKEEPKKEEAANTNSKFADYAELHIPVITEEALELTKESYDYIASNPTLFPANSDQDIQTVKGMVDSSITYKHLNKNATPYFNKVLSFSGYVVSIEETPIEDTSDTIAILHVMDDEEFSYEVILYKSTGDILEEDYVQFWGVPVGPYSFENVSGGSTNVQVFMGSHIEKLPQ
ncbi:hypothetical protein [Neobacillus niacini]|uniref:hypothetical protein n=1 Tax=Neobacillus niacini TaxID=86668 RepID=UPI002FFFF1E6